MGSRRSSEHDTDSDEESYCSSDHEGWKYFNEGCPRRHKWVEDKLPHPSRGTIAAQARQELDNQNEKSSEVRTAKEATHQEPQYKASDTDTLLKYRKKLISNANTKPRGEGVVTQGTHPAAARLIALSRLRKKGSPAERRKVTNELNAAVFRTWRQIQSAAEAGTLQTDTIQGNAIQVDLTGTGAEVASKVNTPQIPLEIPLGDDWSSSLAGLIRARLLSSSYGASDKRQATPVDEATSTLHGMHLKESKSQGWQARRVPKGWVRLHNALLDGSTSVRPGLRMKKTKRRSRSNNSRSRPSVGSTDGTTPPNASTRHVAQNDEAQIIDLVSPVLSPRLGPTAAGESSPPTSNPLRYPPSDDQAPDCDQQAERSILDCPRSAKVTLQVSNTSVNVPSEPVFCIGSISPAHANDLMRHSLSSEMNLRTLLQDVRDISRGAYEASGLPVFSDSHPRVADEIARISVDFYDQQKDEANWNHVHWGIGRLAVDSMNAGRSRPYPFSFEDVTRAIMTKESKRMLSQISKVSATSIKDKVKLTDFVLTYNAGESVVQAIDEAVLRIGEPKNSTINTIMGKTLSRAPIAVAIETKSAVASKQNLDKQTQSWACPFYARLFNLIRAQDKVSDAISLPPLPMLHVSGDSWDFFFVMIDDVPLTGDSDAMGSYKESTRITVASSKTRHGVDKIVLMLQFLMTWLERSYMPWFFRSVCGRNWLPPSID